MTASPPSFDTFFSQQRHQNSTSSSSGGYPSNPFPDNSINFTTNQLLTEEPPSLQRRGSNASLHSHASRHRSGSGASVAGLAGGGGANGEQRQDSIPFQSTLINTAEKVGFPSPLGMASNQPSPGMQQGMGEGTYMYSNNNESYPQAQGNQAYDQTWRKENSHQLFGLSNLPAQNIYNQSANQPSPYANHSTPGSSSFVGDTPASMGGYEGMQGLTGHESYMMDQGTPFAGTSPYNNGNGMYTGSNGQNGQGYADNGNWNELFNSGRDQGETNDTGMGMDESLEDLIRSLSREPSPQPQSGDIYNQQQQQFSQNAQNPFQSYTPDPAFQQDSGSGSRSSSPYPVIAAPSPSYINSGIRPGSSSGNSSLNKPQSPPALVMPNNAPSPSLAALPPINTQATAQSQSQNQPQPAAQGHALANQMGGMGGLLPPTNPALEHLTGMMGISPIAPGGDGPQIFVQPSTPISGLKDGRGHFDAALRRAAAQAAMKHQQQPQDQTTAQQSGQNQSQMSTVNSVPPYNSNQQPHVSPQMQHQRSPSPSHPLDFAAQMQMANTSSWADLGSNLAMQQQRPRSKSDSGVPGVPPQDFDRQAMAQLMAQAQFMSLAQGQGGNVGMMNGNNGTEGQQAGVDGDWRNNVGAWLSSMGIDGSAAQGFTSQHTSPQFQQQGYPQQQSYSQGIPPGTMNPNQIPGNDQTELLRQVEQQHQLSQLQAQKSKQNPLSVNTAASTSSGVLKYEPGEFSPTSLAFYQSRGILPPLTNQPNQSGQNDNGASMSAPNFNAQFPYLTQQTNQQGGNFAQYPSTAGPAQMSFLNPAAGYGAERRRSFTEGLKHPASGAGTPGYGVGLMANHQGQSPFGTLDPGRLRGVSPGSSGHRRTAKSEDFGRGGWGLGAGGSTTEFLNSITANDGSLIPPLRGRSGSHSRHSSGSSVRSPSPALSISSQGSSYSHASDSGRMSMPPGGQVPQQRSGGRGKVAKMKVTSMATEVAATSRRTNEGVHVCPVPGCGSTFTRHFNLKGHIRSHNDERPYKCLYDGCPKSVTGFARQHDCKRHMLLHEGLRPFECEGCGKKFARLDALTRHHKSEQGQECAISHPLPVNPDGTAMSESQYKTYKQNQQMLNPASARLSVSGKGGTRSRASSFGSSAGISGDEGDERIDLGTGSGMEDYDLA